MKHLPKVFIVLDTVFAAVWAVLSVGAYYGGEAGYMIFTGLACLYSCAEVAYNKDYWAPGRLLVADPDVVPIIRSGGLVQKEGVIYVVRRIDGNRVWVTLPTWRERAWWWGIGKKLPEKAL